jgi:hypothetical protein
MVSIDAKQILEEVKENRAKLDSCDLHDFSIVNLKHGILKEYQCSKCNGKVDLIAKSWYEKGLKHGRGEK